jgi:hypothetical protein
MVLLYLVDHYLAAKMLGCEIKTLFAHSIGMYLSLSMLLVVVLGYPRNLFS